MMPRASEAEALYEGIAQKGFGVPSLDGAPFRWAPCGGGGSPRCHKAKNPVGQKQSNTNKRISAITNNHRGTSGMSANYE